MNTQIAKKFDYALVSSLDYSSKNRLRKEHQLKYVSFYSFKRTPKIYPRDQGNSTCYRNSSKVSFLFSIGFLSQGIIITFELADVINLPTI